MAPAITPVFWNLIRTPPEKRDMAKIGQMMLNRGRWEGKQLISQQWLKDAVTPTEHGPDYGYLWWLNTRQKQWPSGPRSSFAAVGNGGNIIWIDPEHDIS